MRSDQILCVGIGQTGVVSDKSRLRTRPGGQVDIPGALALERVDRNVFFGRGLGNCR